MRDNKEPSIAAIMFLMAVIIAFLVVSQDFYLENMTETVTESDVEQATALEILEVD